MCLLSRDEVTNNVNDDVCVAVDVGDDFTIHWFDGGGVRHDFVDVVPVHGGYAGFLGGIARQDGEEPCSSGVCHSEVALQRRGRVRHALHVSDVAVKVQPVPFSSSGACSTERGVVAGVVGTEWVDADEEAGCGFAGSGGGQCAGSYEPHDGTGDPRKCQ